MREAEEILKDFADCRDIVRLMELQIEAGGFFNCEAGPQAVITFDPGISEETRAAFIRELKRELALHLFGLKHVSD